MDNKKLISLSVAFVLVVVAILGGVFATRNVGKSVKTITHEEAVNKLNKMVKRIEPKSGTAYKSSVEYSDNNDVSASELPDIDTCSVTVKANTALYAEIYASPEKAGEGTDGWLCEMAKKFNAQNHSSNGQPISIQIRNVSSGQAVDYITSGKAIPDGFSPSNSFWIKMLENKGIKTNVINNSLVSNTAGIVMKNSVVKSFKKDYGDVNITNIVKAVTDGKISMGYTNPFSSTTGLNFLTCVLQDLDSENPLSEKAISGFQKFQQNIPFVSLTTVQMRNAFENGTLDACILEHQLFVNDATLSSNYTFVPYGYIHDNPLVSVSNITNDKEDILKQFSEFCSTDSAKKDAIKYGFNQSNYTSTLPELTGKQLIAMQKTYKENKDDKTVAAVFVCDVSGSMDGQPIQSLRISLINSMKYINSKNIVGLVSYSDGVTIETPLAPFDLNQQTLYKGSVEHLIAGGGTATYDAVCVGLQMLQKQMDKTPDVKPMLFVLSDGEQNIGNSLKNITTIVKGLNIPVYTIGYNASLTDLSKLSAINEAANINADSDDVIYQLKSLFNASL